MRVLKKGYPNTSRVAFFSVWIMRKPITTQTADAGSSRG